MRPSARSPDHVSSCAQPQRGSPTVAGSTAGTPVHPVDAVYASSAWPAAAEDLATFVRKWARCRCATNGRELDVLVLHRRVRYLVQALSGMPFEDYLQKYIFDPLGMKDTRSPSHQTSWTASPPTTCVVTTDARRGRPRRALRRAPTFVSGGGGLLCTMADYPASAKCCRGGDSTGQHHRPAHLEVMTQNHCRVAATLTQMGSVPSPKRATKHRIRPGFATTWVKWRLG